MKHLVYRVCFGTAVILSLFILYVLYNFVSFDLEVVTDKDGNQFHFYKESQLDHDKSITSNNKILYKTPIQDITPHSKNFHRVESKTAGQNLTTRVSLFNKEIDRIREEIVSVRGMSDWRPITSPSPHVLWCNEDNFMFSLQNYDQVQTVVLPWEEATKPDSAGQWSSLDDKSNLLIQTYYDWTASEPLCRYIKTRGFTNARWDAVYNRTCNTDYTQAFIPKSLEFVYFYGKPINRRDYWPNDGNSYPPYFYTALPDRVLYLHVIQDAVLTMSGDVHTGNLKLVPYGCSQDINPDPPNDYKEVPIWNEVFVLTQYWGDKFFHKMLELTPRLAPYIEFLQKNKHIKIHVSEKHGYTRETLKFLDINPERIITGTSRVKILYLPQATPCGFPQVQELQILSKLYTDKIKHFGLGTQNLVVLVQRSGLRKFRKKEEIAYIVEKAALDFGLEFMLFMDNPSPGMEEAMHIFYQAVIVVAPHGAGLANLVYSQPGTLVIEGVCNPPHINMCFQWMSHILGHRYHGISSKEGCESEIVIEPSLIDVILRSYLGVKNTNSSIAFGSS